MLTRSATYALRAMVALGALEPTEFAGTSRIAETAVVPRNYVGKILLQLGKRGFVESQRGPRGGFRLARAPEAISLHDIVACVEDVGRWDECAFGENRCSDELPCALHHRWKSVRDTYLSLLKNTSLAELLANELASACTAHVVSCSVRRS